MKKIYNISKMFLYGVVALMATACTDTWDSHYEVNGELNSDKTLWDLIEERDELAGFREQLEKVGYDSLLSMNRFYTVWAPVGENAYLETTDLKRLEKEFVQNHIANFSHTVSSAMKDDNSVKMLNGKRIAFSRRSGALAFDNVEVTEHYNIQAKNGILHLIGGNGDYAQFRANLWEKLAVVDTLSLFHKYMMEEMDSTIDYNRSIELGRNEAGEMVYADTVWSYSNPWWSKIGQFNNEDSSYILIAPSNKAWRDKYAEISTYFNYVPEQAVENPDSLRDMYTKEVMCRHLAFSNTVQKAAGKDSMISNYQVYYEPLVFSGREKDSLFLDEITSEEVSNGTIHIVDQLNYSLTKVFFDTIRIEGENTYYCDEYGKVGETNMSCEVVSIEKDALHVDSITDPAKKDSILYYYEVSGKKYMRVATSSFTGTLNVNYTIPGAFSGKYRVKLVLVPEVYDESATPIQDHTDITMKIVPNGSSKNAVDMTYSLTKGTLNCLHAMDTLVLKTKDGEDYVSIPNCEYGLEESKTKLTVSSKASSKNRGAAAKTLRIDCIILEPVE